MINIKESCPPIKLSGRSSFLISFNYDPEIVEAVKLLPNAIYHKKTKEWEIPILSLSQALDTLTLKDDINFSIIPGVQKKPFSEPPLTEEEISKFKIKPFEHQLEAINFMLANPKSLLLDAPGLGKTNEVIWFAETLHRRGIIDHCFIICGVNAVKQNWKKEIAKFSSESCRVLGEKITKTGSIRYDTIPNRAAEIKDGVKDFFLITNIETLRADEIIEAVQKSKEKFGLIAVDEIHHCASKHAQQSSNLLKLRSDYKVGMTGTLITNNALSAYVPLSWTENDQATLTNYKAQYCEFGGFQNSQVIGYKNLDLLRDEIESCSIRRTLDQVRDSMPLKQINFELLEMDDDHKKFYEAIKAGVKEEADKVELKSSNLLALTTRLRQATSFPGILTSNQIAATKLDRCVDMVEELISSGEKVVVFSQFKDPIYELQKRLAKYDPLVCTGDIKDSIVSANVDKFQNDPSSMIFLGTTARVGTGLTLNASKYLIFIDQPWTFSEFTQACDRIYRITNTRPAIITVLGCQGTIDERVWEIVNTKKETGDYLVDGIESESFTNQLRDIIRDL